MNELPLHCVSLPAKNPSPDGKSPLVLMLHGYGSHENDLFSFAQDLNKTHHILSLRAPLRLGHGGFAWYEINWNESGEKWTDVEAGLKSIQLIEDFIDNVEDFYPVDSSDITLVGFSQGAIMSYSLSFRHPERITAVAALSGYIVQELMPQKAAMEAVLKIPYLVIHGTMDPVIPISWAEQSVAYLEQLKISHVFRQYPMPHGINPQAYEDFKNWFEGL